MKTNLVELSCDLADLLVYRIAKDNGVKDEEIFDVDDLEQRYTEKYQEEFDKWYDTFYSLLEEDGIEHENM